MQERPSTPPAPAPVDSDSPAPRDAAPLSDGPARPRPTALLLARAAALVFSIATVTLLAVQAGLSGCATTTPEPEYQFAEDPALPASPDPAESATSTSHPGKSKKPHYFPGPKAPAGPWAYPDQDERPAQAPAQQPQQQQSGPR